MTTAAVEEYETILSVGDTTFLDYRGIKVKREGYGHPKPSALNQRSISQQRNSVKLAAPS